MANNVYRPLNSLEVVKLDCVLFLDIETVPAYPDFEMLPEAFQSLWREKSVRYKRDNEEKTPEELYSEFAGIPAEFGRIICISAGYVKTDPATGKLGFRVKSFYGDDEKSILEAFSQMLDGYFNDCNKHYLCAHNGIEFDFPYVARRMLINGLRLPSLLNVPGTKSWNNKWLLDTMELWRFGDYKNFTSLNLLAACFNIPSPKDDISGKDVARVYYQDNDLERIATYCQKDVVTLARVFMCFAGLTPLTDEHIIFV